jgi:hypothetical protein
LVSVCQGVFPDVRPIQGQAYFADVFTMKKTTVRVLVLAAIFAWPIVLSYQLWQAEQQLAEATKVQEKVSVRLADARAKADPQVAQKEKR